MHDSTQLQDDGARPSALFAPLTCKSLTLPNRIVMAPMTRSFTEKGVPLPAVADYYAARARGGVGLILTEGTVIDRPSSKNDHKLPDFHGDALPRWQNIFDTVHQAGGRIAPQLWHVGSIGLEDAATWNPSPIDSPSGINAFARQPQPDVAPASEEAVADIIAAFAAAAADAACIGADAIELHGAHGYLIDQFFWSATNQRQDIWGGATLGERSRFAAQAIKQVRSAIPQDLPLSLRISQWKIGAYDTKLASSPDALEEWLSPLAEAGVDIFHCSQRRFWEAEFEGSDLNLAGWVKKVTGKITITVGSIGLDGDFIGAFGGKTSQSAPIDEVERRLERGDFDLVAVGRALLADPQWAAKIRAGRTDFRPFTTECLQTLA